VTGLPPLKVALPSEPPLPVCLIELFAFAD
jgi:hypothetical protein